MAIPGADRKVRVAVALVLLTALSWPAGAMERVTFLEEETAGEASSGSMEPSTSTPITATRTVEGRVLLETTLGDMVLQGRDGQVWPLKRERIVQRDKDSRPFQPLTREEMGQAVLEELPPGFDVYTTNHYVVCYNTSRAYADWTGSLLERLQTAFINYWRYRDLDLNDPQFPLVAIVFATNQGYVEYSRELLGEAAAATAAYYSINSNQLVLYDQTGVEGRLRGNAGRKTAAHVARLMAQPKALHMLATTVHEATHQIAFNTGVHTRNSDCPVWLAEGMAMFFETPDVTSSKGWRTVGNVNKLRFNQFRDYARRRPADSLETLIASDDRIHNMELAGDAYAEAWALTYYLIKQRPREFVRYVKLVAAKKPYIWDSPEQRLAEFKEIFGEDLDALDLSMRKYMASLLR